MFSNGTECPSKSFNNYILISNIFSIFIGQPVIVKLLWTTFHSKRKDILNINLAVFHNIQYLLSTMHVCIVYFNRELNSNMVSFLTVYLLMGGPLTLVFICMERYIAVIHPTFYPLLKKYRCREGCSLSVWLLAVPPALMKALSEDLHVFMELWSMDAIVYTILCLVVIIMAWSNVAILKALKNSPSSTDKLHPVKKRAFETVRAIFIASFLCYIPVVILIKYKTVAKSSSCIVAPICVFLVSVASVVHPVLYLSAKGQLFPCQTQTK